MLGNATVNNTVTNTTNGATVELALGGILLLVVVIVIVMDLMVMAALIADTETVGSIRWILGNILAACVIGALGLVLNQVFAIGSVNDPNRTGYIPTACLVFVPLMALGISGRVLNTTFYAITVFVVVRWWNKPVLAPRNTKYFIIATAFVWLLAIPLSAPSFVSDATAPLCKMEVRAYTVYISLWVSYFLILSSPILLTLLILVITVCFIKRRTITENNAGRKALLKFGFFLVIGQGIAAIGQIICPAVLLAVLPHTDQVLAATVVTAIYELSLIPTPILIGIFFKPVQLKLRHWICSCRSKCPAGTTASQDITRDILRVSS